MTDHLRLATIVDIEAALADLAGAIDLPPTPDLASAVGVRLRLSAPYAAPSRQVPVPMSRRRPIIRSLRRSLLLAAAITLLVVGGVLGVRFGLQLLEIDFGPLPSVSAPPTTTARPSDSGTPWPSIDAGARLELGLRSTLDEAVEAAGFALLVPTDLGPPDVVYLGGTPLRGQVAFGYRPRPELPADDVYLAGLGLLITQNQGRLDEGLARKLVDMGTGVVVPVEVDGAPGIWMAGEPHMFWYLDPGGEVIAGSDRRVGDTLAWQRQGILYRIEGAGTMERALQIARSMRAP
jgi:hypothetical protein